MKLPNRWRNLGLAALSGILTALSFPDWNFSFLAWIALIPLLLALREAPTWKSAALVGWVGGFVGFLGVIGWLYILGPYTGVGVPLGYVFAGGGAALLAAYLALFVALFAALVVVLLPREGWGYVLGVPCLWVFAEALRGAEGFFLGFPWGALGYSQWSVLPVAQVAAIGGVPLVSLVIVSVNTALVEAWTHRFHRIHAFRHSIPAAAFLVATLLYGWLQLTIFRPVTSDTLSVAVAPGNIPQKERWRADSFQENFRHYFDLIGNAAKKQPDLIVVPETSIMVPWLRQEDWDALVGVLKENRTPLLFGMPKVGQRGSVAREGYNAAALVDADGRILGEYYKQHLVPFGEYVPGRNILPKFIVEKVIGVADFNFGPEANVLTLPMKGGGEARIGVPICFESVFSNLSVEFVRNGANLLSVITNDGWYDGTPAAAQHNAFAVFRAIETRRALVRSANRGITCLIEPTGEIQPNLVFGDDREGIVFGAVPLLTEKTLFVRLGDWVSLATVLATLGWMVARVWQPQNGRRKSEAAERKKPISQSK